MRGAEFRVLGPVEVAVDQTTIEIGSAKQRALLATLGRLLTGAQS